MLPVQIAQPVQGVNIKTDDALTREINRAFKTENILRALDYFEIDVLMKNRSAYIYGALAG